MNDKQLVAIHAAKHVQNDMLVGLGTGSTANFFIEELARRQTEENLKITTISSSNISMIKAQSLGLNVIGLQQVNAIDLYIDGADEITPDLNLLKGRGYDLVMEKLLAKAAKQFFVVADKSKLVDCIGTNFAIPRGLDLKAVSLYELHGNEARYGPVLASLPTLLSRTLRDAAGDASYGGDI